METVATRLQQSHNKESRFLSEVEEILKSSLKKLQSIELHQREKIKEYATTCENRLKEQQKATITNERQLKEKEIEADVLETKIDAEEKLIKMLQEELACVKEQHETLNKGADSASGVSEEKVRHLNAEDAQFREYTAMEIDKVKGGWLQVIFTQVDSERPASRFFFLLKVDEKRKYVVGDCQPPIPDMSTLLDRLNSSNNLSKFVHSVRKRFKVLAQK